MRYLPFSTSNVQALIAGGVDLRHQLRRRSRITSGLCGVAFLVLSGTAFSQGGPNAYHLFQKYGENGSADTLFYFDLNNGNGTEVSQLRRNADQGKLARLKTNLFSEIGRSRDLPATVGEVFLGPLRGADGQVRSALLVEASTGYTVYFDQLGKGGNLGRITTMIKRGFESVAAPDANFALLMRRNSSGRTEGAYLYHGTMGNAAYLGGLDELEIDPPVTAVAKLPTLGGQISAAPIVASEETVGYVVIDNDGGKISFLDLSGSVSRIASRTTDIALSEVMSAEQLNPSTQRFVPVPLQDDESTTYAVLIVDVGSGRLALMDGLRNPRPRVGELQRNVYSALRGGLRTDAYRTFAVADANGSNGATRGVWILDSLTGDMVYIESPGTPGSIRIRRVVMDR